MSRLFFLFILSLFINQQLWIFTSFLICTYQNKIHACQNTEAPDFITGTGMLTAGAILANDRCMGYSVPMQSNNRAEGSPLEPPYQKLSECRVLRVASNEAPDVCCPPGNSCNPHIQTGTQLLAETFPIAVNVSRPNECSISLASCPRTMLMYGKEASNRKQEIDSQLYTFPQCRLLRNPSHTYLQKHDKDSIP